jgi:hypothetical protein
MSDEMERLITVRDQLPLADLLAELEVEARTRSRSLEAQGRVPHGFTAQHYPLTPAEERDLHRQRAAWALATDPATLRALLAGEAVPRHRLQGDYLQVLERWPQ